jgi:hypothetical protein
LHEFAYPMFPLQLQKGKHVPTVKGQLLNMFFRLRPDCGPFCATWSLKHLTSGPQETNIAPGWILCTALGKRHQTGNLDLFWGSYFFCTTSKQENVCHLDNFGLSLNLAPVCTCQQMTPAKGCCMDLHIYSFWGYKWTTWAFMGWVCTVRIVVSWSFMPHRNLKLTWHLIGYFSGYWDTTKKHKKIGVCIAWIWGLFPLLFTTSKGKHVPCSFFSGWAWTVRPFVRHGVSHTIGLHKLTAWKCHMMPAQNVAKICNEFHK